MQPVFAGKNTCVAGAWRRLVAVCVNLQNKVCQAVVCFDSKSYLCSPFYF